METISDDQYVHLRTPEDIQKYLHDKTVFLESAYAADTNEGIAANITYARWAQTELYRWGIQAVFVPHLCYDQLPEHVNSPDKGGNIGRATRYYPGKEKGWRDFSRFRNVADAVVFAVKNGKMSAGMKKVLDQIPPEKVYILHEPCPCCV